MAAMFGWASRASVSVSRRNIRRYDLVDELAAADDLQRDAAARALLLGLVDDPHPALAELAEDAEAADRAG